MALLGAGPMARPIPRMPQSPPPSMIDPSGSQYGGAGALPHAMPMPGQQVENAYGALGHPALAHILAAAAAAHPQSRLFPQMRGAKLNPLLRALVPSPRFEQ